MSTLQSTRATPPSDLFPYTPRFLDVSGHRIHYVDEGTGPTLLFVHPAPASSFMYREFVARLSRRFRVIALDYPGFGRSSVPEKISAPELARAVADFMTALDLFDVTMAVHDTGGVVGLGAAALVPERIRAFVICDAVGFPLDNFRKVRIMLRLVTSPPFRWLNRRLNLLPWLVVNLGPVSRRLPPEVKRTHLATFPTAASRDRIVDLLRELLDQTAWMTEMERTLRRICSDRPALIMFGEHDPVNHAGFPARYCRNFPKHRVREVPGEGHFPHEGAPDFMMDQIEEWWDEDVEGCA